MPKLSPAAADGAESKADGCLYWSFVLIGCGMRLPWNALLSAIDYFDDVYPVRPEILLFVEDCLRHLSRTVTPFAGFL